MGCLPVAAVATVALSRNTGLNYARELYLGLREAADPYDCQIVGGDTASWPGKLAMTVSILGRSAGTAPVTRSGARPGDGIYVTGPLGGSILGRHMTFLPRIREGRQLAQSGVVSAMIDLSDGLSRDLDHICGNSGVGAILEAQAVPIHEDALALSSRDGVDPLDHALHDGEDHELLFTARASPPLGARIGTIQAEKGIFLRRNGRILALPARGWEHAM
jgi:thiamine-monophosphate kinase